MRKDKGSLRKVEKEIEKLRKDIDTMRRWRGIITDVRTIGRDDIIWNPLDELQMFEALRLPNALPNEKKKQGNKR